MASEIQDMTQSETFARRDLVVGAFEAAWLKALTAECVTSDNVASVPSELLRSVLLSLNADVADAKALGNLAFMRWRAEVQFDAARPAALSFN
jgi:hypothetical protein